MESAVVTQLENEYYVTIDGEDYETSYNILDIVMHGQSNGLKYDACPISTVYVQDGNYYMVIQLNVLGKEDKTKTFKLIGDNLQAFQQKVNNYRAYNYSDEPESKGNLRF